MKEDKNPEKVVVYPQDWNIDIGHRYCDRCGILLTKDNNKCGFEICDRCNDILEKSTEREKEDDKE